MERAAVYLYNMQYNLLINSPWVSKLVDNCTYFDLIIAYLICISYLVCSYLRLGAQSNGCKFNKKPLYRYSGCHGYDASAFNIVLGLTWHLDDTKYSLSSDGTKENLFYKETLEQAIKILESRRRNNSDTSDHPFTED